jgi:hypothetical protein
MLVYPQDQGGLVRLHRHVAQGRYIRNLGVDIAAHRLQVLEYVFRNPPWPSLRHHPTILRHPGQGYAASCKRASEKADPANFALSGF